MTEMFLDLHVTTNCNLHCKHCYLSNEHRKIGDMPFDIVVDIIDDYMNLDHPVRPRGIILSGGEASMHPEIKEIIKWVHREHGHVRMSSNGFKIPEIIDVFDNHDGIQISLDGNEQHHDWLRGKGSYDIAIEALRALAQAGVHHSIMFTAHAYNTRHLAIFKHVLAMARMLGCAGIHVNEYHTIQNRGVHPCDIDIQKKLWKLVEKHGFPACKQNCYHQGCIGGVLGCSVLPDGTYWDCSRHQTILGKYPQMLSEVLRWDCIAERKALPVPCRKAR